MIVCFEGVAMEHFMELNRLILLVDLLQGNAVTKQIMQIASFIVSFNLKFYNDQPHTTCGY